MGTTNDAKSIEQPNMIIIHLENNRKTNTVSKSKVLPKKCSWSPEEQEALLKGVDKYGEGRWRLILSTSNAFHPTRSPVDLKDKFRLVKRVSSYYRLDKQRWYEVLDDDTLRLDTFGEPKVVFTRFPHDAAKVFASIRSKSKDASFTLRVIKRESEGLQKIHIYRITLVDMKWKITKQSTVFSAKALFKGVDNASVTSSSSQKPAV